MPRSPEQEERARIDVQLADCGWLVHEASQAPFTGSVQERYEHWLRKLLDELNEELAA